MDNEFILQDRIQKIQQVINKYNEINFYISYSGGKDSNVLSALVDMALPDNTIPRVYCNTGIEYKIIVDFVKDKAAKDSRFEIIQPKVPIKPMLETDGYPFKSKRHSVNVACYQSMGLKSKTVQHYLDISEDGKHWSSWKLCPKVLEYQFSPEFDLKISDKCCKNLKQKPLAEWQRERERV